MNVITITREYGAGGAEVARNLAQALGWELLDRELLHQAAQTQHVPDIELERLDEQAITMADRFRMHPPHQKYLEGLRQAAQQAAERGRVILVGRGARHLLGERPDCLHLRLVAPGPGEPNAWRVWRAGRRKSRWPVAPKWTGRDGSLPATSSVTPLCNQPNMTWWSIRAVCRWKTWWPSCRPPWPPRRRRPWPAAGQRVLTLSREFGAGDQGFAPPLAERLGLHVCDREMLEQQAIRLGVPEAELERIDEQPAGIFQRFRPGSLYQRYFQALEQLTREMAERGDMLLVGRGGCLVSPRPADRLSSPPHRDDGHPAAPRHGVSLGPRERGAELIAQSDEQRRAFCQNYFGADWCDPLEYHVTVNSGRWDRWRWTWWPWPPSGTGTPNQRFQPD